MDGVNYKDRCGGLTPDLMSKASLSKLRELNITAVDVLFKDNDDVEEVKVWPVQDIEGDASKATTMHSGGDSPAPREEVKEDARRMTMLP